MNLLADWCERGLRQYAADNDVEIVGQFGDYQKRHKSHQRHSFQSMLKDIEAFKPNVILVQRLDRFGAADRNELLEKRNGSTVLERVRQHDFRLATMKHELVISQTCGTK